MADGTQGSSKVAPEMADSGAFLHLGAKHNEFPAFSSRQAFTMGVVNSIIYPAVGG